MNDRMQRYRITIEREDFSVKKQSTVKRWEKLYEQTFDRLAVEELIAKLNQTEVPTP